MLAVTVRSRLRFALTVCANRWCIRGGAHAATRYILVSKRIGPPPKAVIKKVRKMSGLIALLDDVAALTRVAATSIDDVASMAAKAGTKAAGVIKGRSKRISSSRLRL